MASNDSPYATAWMITRVSHGPVNTVTVDGCPFAGFSPIDRANPGKDDGRAWTLRDGGGGHLNPHRRPWWTLHPESTVPGPNVSNDGESGGREVFK